MRKRKKITVKEKIQSRYSNIDELYPLVIETKEKNLLSTKEFEYLFNYKLTVKIPGKVVADSRPRGIEDITSKLRGHKYNPNKELLMKIFNEVYVNSILEDLTIFSPIKFDIKIYSHMLQKYQKFHKKNQLEMYIPNMATPDVDNVAKVFYDVFQDRKYQIIYKDNHIIDSRIYKVFTDKEYVEIDIFFNKELSIFEEFVVNDSVDYVYYLISYKHIKNKNINDYVSYVNFLFGDRKYKPAPKKLKYVLKYFPKEYLFNITKTNIAHAKQVDIVIDSIMKGVD